MGKSKSGCLARLPKEQKCQFLIGPCSSWFMPNTIDIWTQPAGHMVDPNQELSDNSKVSLVNDVIMDCDKTILGGNASLSFFVYGSIGCFCYGQIHHVAAGLRSQGQPNICDNNHGQTKHRVSAIVNKMVDIKDDNSRVSCIRFLKESPYPIVIGLTESGSLIIHDCSRNETLAHYKSSEIFVKFLGIADQVSTNICDQVNAKRAKRGNTQQINSCSWPNSKNIFLGISMTKEKTCFLLWLKLKKTLCLRQCEAAINKDNLFEGYQRVDLGIQHYANLICVVESKMLTDTICLLAVAMDDGMIIVLVFDLEKSQVKRSIELIRHRTQICSLSLNIDNLKKHPLGLLASVSRDGLMLVWDIENEFYFADYQAVIDNGSNRGSTSGIDWFALCFINPPSLKQTYIAVSNTSSGVTLLEIPENARSKIRLREIKPTGGGRKNTKCVEPTTIKHDKLLFNLEFDKISNTLISSSLDGNHILWSIQKSQNVENQGPAFELKPQHLIPAMLNDSRSHMMRSSPIREDLVCFALGKAGLKFFNLSSNVMCCKFDMSTSCSLIARRITRANVSPTSIAWHPSHEYRIAIGTLEGRVFRADITPRKASIVEAESKLRSTKVKIKPVEQSMDIDDALGVDYIPIERELEQQNGQNIANHRQTKTDGVYSLCWGPHPASPQDVTKFSIYAVGSMSHRLFVYTSYENSDKLTNYLEQFEDVSLPEASSEASEVAWKPSMDLMALGTLDGKILIVSYLDESHEDRSNHKLFKRLAVIEGPFNRAYIQCLAWHPTKDREDPHYHYLVASSNESPAYVFNLKESLLVAKVKAQLKLETTLSKSDFDNDDGEILNQADSMLTTLSAYVNKLEAHQKAITDIAWNPHEPNQIATASFDRICYVWSIDNSFLEAKLLSKFSARDRLFTLEWSLVDEDLIFTSGHDSTMWAWRPSENSVKKND